MYLTSFFILFSFFTIFSTQDTSKCMEAGTVTETFENIDISGAFEVIVKCGVENTINIDAPEELKEYVIKEIRDNTLYIYIANNKKNVHNKSINIKINIGIKDLKHVNLSGACSLTINDIKNDNLEIDASGANDIHLNGETKNLSVELSGACNLDAKEFITSKVKITLSGATDAIVNVTDELNVEVSGVSKVKYIGNPSKITKDISGMSSLEKY